MRGGCVLMVFVLSAIMVAPARAQTLQEAMARAFQHHPALDAQRANLRALSQEIDRARAGRRPSISLTTGAGHHTDGYRGDSGRFVTHERTVAELRLEASQPLLDWTTGPQVDAAYARQQQGHAELLSTEQQIMLEVATAYLNVLQYGKLLDLHNENVRALARQVSYRREHYARKLGTRTELAQARARHAAAIAQRDSVRAELDIAASAFMRHVGLPPGELTFPDDLPQLPDTLDAVMDEAVQRHPAVRSAYLSVQAAQADTRAAEGKLKPKLSLDATGGWTQRPELSMNRSRDASVQLNLRIPIYQGGADRAQVRSSKERLTQQQANWLDTRLQVRQAAADAWRKLHTARAEIDAFTQAVEANKVAFEGVEAEYSALGDLTLIEVLNAQQELFVAEVALVRAQTQAVLSHLVLLAAQGRLTAEEMGLAHKW